MQEYSVNGVVFALYVSTDGRVYRIEVPALGTPAGPLVVTVNTFDTVADAQAWLDMLGSIFG